MSDGDIRSTSSPGAPGFRALSLVGAGLGLLFGSIGAVYVPGLLPVWIVIGGVAAGAVYIVAADRATNRTPPPRRAVGRDAVLAGVAAAAVCLVLTGIVTVLGAASGPVILLVVLALALWTWRARESLLGRGPASTDIRGGHRSAADLAGQAPDLDPDAGDMSTPALCLAWHRTYFVLLDAPVGLDRRPIVTRRRHLLDELERRDPSGIENWLRNGARASSDPTRYLSPATRRSP